MENVTINFNSKSELDSAIMKVIETVMNNRHLFKVNSQPSQNKWQIIVGSNVGFTPEEKRTYNEFSTLRL